MSKIIFTRAVSGEFDLNEAKLAKLEIHKVSNEPRVPAELRDAAMRTMISETRRTANAGRISFSQAASVVVRERPQLFKLTRCASAHDASTDVELVEASE